MIASTNISVEDYLNLKHIHMPSEDERNYMLGAGGGIHNVLFQGDITSSFVDSPDSSDSLSDRSKVPPYFFRLTKKMLDIFSKALPSVNVEELYAEHRMYFFDHIPFYGEIHDDCSQYTIICYYDIGSDVIGGELGFFDKDESYMIEKIKPVTGDIVIFNGYHGVLKTFAKGPDNKRCVWTICVNGHF
jgi:hypothetical protein